MGETLPDDMHLTANVLASVASLIDVSTEYTSYYNVTKIHPSVCHSIWGKDRPKDENGKSTMGCGSGMGLSWRLVGVWRKGKGKNAKNVLFGRVYSIHTLLQRHSPGCATVLLCLIVRRASGRGRDEVVLALVAGVTERERSIQRGVHAECGYCY